MLQWFIMFKTRLILISFSKKIGNSETSRTGKHNVVDLHT